MTRFQTVPDLKLSLWQSAVTEAIRHASQGDTATLLKHPKVQATHRHVSQQANVKPKKLQSHLKKHHDKETYLSFLMYEYANAKYHNDTKKMKQLDEDIRKYSTDDLMGWMTCVTTYLDYLYEWGTPYYRKWYDYGAIDQFAVIDYRIPNDGKVAIIADWGTGMPDAKALLKSILTEHEPDVILHLGDIYYSGTPKESKEHIVKVFEEAFQETQKDPIPVYSIPGNHDYYAFGSGFYHEVIDVMNTKESWKQEASYFCLKTEDETWQFLGMDTGRHDANPIADLFTVHTTWLEESEVLWHYDKLIHFSGSTILLSHHQLFSQHLVLQLKNCQPTWLNSNLYNTFSPYFNQISAWFWGHEHNLAFFKEGLYGLKKGRLVGCSAFEEMKSDSPYSPFNRKHKRNVPYVPKMPKLTKKDGYYYHGYALLDFSARSHERDDILCKYFEFPSWGMVSPDPSELKSTKVYEEFINYCDSNH